jgi:hypothetical protein
MAHDFPKGSQMDNSPLLPIEVASPGPTGRRAAALAQNQCCASRRGIIGLAYLAAGEVLRPRWSSRKSCAIPVVNYHLGALAHLGVARAYALQAGVLTSAARQRSKESPATIGLADPAALAKARAAYQDFFNLWKGADPDIPVQKQAQAEYRMLQ